jgi:glycogen operon protein
LGAHPVDGGARFAVASTSADAVELCLVESDPEGGPPAEKRIELTQRTFGVWHAVVSGVGAGQHYGYRVHGRYDPAAGLHANPAKLLADPYARRLAGRLTDLDAALGYLGDPMSGPPSPFDSAGAVPLSVLTGEPGGPDPGPRPRVPWADTVIYELHVRGYTKTHPEVPAEHRGTYLGLAHPAVVEHLRALGVTAVELLPVHSVVDEAGLLRRGMRNYWGYSTLGFLAPHAGYAARPGREIDEFRTMVAALHAAGIEVILDVVYNHTAEGDLTGPTLSYRGLDAPAYYVHGPRGDLVNITGCGHTLDAGSPTVARLVGDSLRYWASLGVDGFRFDLASVLGRPGAGPFDPHAGLLTMITCDPALADLKLIAEPWDATGEGYQVGGFGPQWVEWNGRYRDAARDFWRGAGSVGELARRLTGSEDLYARSGRRPWASVNFVTAHDGFTLRDLVSYRRKHNEDNGEDNRDGTDDNRSQNFGVEGDPPPAPVPADPAPTAVQTAPAPTAVRTAPAPATVLADRLATARGLLATLLLSTGTPMLTAGDERWRTQRGNNNAYCQDGPLSWLDWAPSAEAEELTRFVALLARARRHVPGRDAFFRAEDVMWWHPAGREFTQADWHDGGLHTLSVHAPEGGLLILHAGSEPLDYRLPPVALTPLLDSGCPDGVPADTSPLEPGAPLLVAPRSAVLLVPTP